MQKIINITGKGRKNKINDGKFYYCTLSFTLAVFQTFQDIPVPSAGAHSACSVICLKCHLQKA